VVELDADEYLEIPVGEGYTVEVEAYIGAKGSGIKVATGESEPFTVLDGKATPVKVKLSPVSVTGSGTFSYEVSYPENARLEIKLIKWPGFADVTLTPTETTTTGEFTKSSETKTLDAGSYLLTIKVSEGEFYTGLVEAVHIYPNLETKYKKVFDDSEMAAKNNDAKLENIKIKDSGNDVPVEDLETTNPHISVNFLFKSDMEIDVIAKPVDKFATVKFAMGAFDSNPGTWTEAGVEGSETREGKVSPANESDVLFVEVTAADNTTKKVYKVTITYKQPTSVTLERVDANGSANETTTTLTLHFSAVIDGLSKDDIDLSGDIVKGAFVDSAAPVYTLGISGFTETTTLAVQINDKEGYIINNSPTAQVKIFKAGVKVKVGDEYQYVAVTGEGGVVEYNADQTVYTFSKQAEWEKSYAYFAVDFGETDKLSDFGKVTFKYQGVSGDIGYKRILIVASATPFIGDLPTGTNQLNASQWVSGAFVEGPQMNGTSETPVTLIIPKDKADTYTASTVYFSIYINTQGSPGTPTVYKVSDITFVKDGGAVSGATLDSIKVKTAPTKDTYGEDEPFDPDGLVITANNLYGTTPITGYAEDITYSAGNDDFVFKVDGDVITTGTVMQADYSDQKITVTVEYKSKPATFEVKVGDVPLDPFDEAVGMTTGIEAQGSASFEGGIIDLTNTTSSALFTITLPSATSVSGSKTIKVEYICKLVTGSPDVIWKTPSWSDPPNIGSNNIYPTLTVGVVSNLEMPETVYDDGTTTIAFQRNGDTNAFKIKIISVKVE